MPSSKILYLVKRNNESPKLNTLHYQRKTKAANAINNPVVHELFKSEYTCYCKELS